MDWTVLGIILVALVVGYIVGGAIWTERPAPFEARSYTESFPPSEYDIDVPLTITRVSRPKVFENNVVESNRSFGRFFLTSDHPIVYLFEREDGSQLLLHVYADGEADLAERPKDGDGWSPPISGVAR